MSRYGISARSLSGSVTTTWASSIGQHFRVFCPAETQALHRLHGPRTGRQSDFLAITAHTPADNTKRPTSLLCDGCHSVNYNIETKSVTEWNVGCEKCHDREAPTPPNLRARTL